MELFWFIIISIVLSIFFILDGYDFGAGIIHLFFAKEEKDKVVIAKSAGLFWDSNEVWLVAAGGMLFMAFPTFYASVFSGFYLPLMFVLWLIIFRAIGLELRSHFNFQMWKDLWDKAFGLSSLLLALFFGIALGNVIRGVNLGGVENGISKYEPHYFFLPLWDSSFSPNSIHPGVIDWFTLIVGVMAVLTLTIHGANWVILKTQSSINTKLKPLIVKLTAVLFSCTLGAIFSKYYMDGDSFMNFIETPFFVLFPIIYFTGLAGLFFRNKIGNDALHFMFSTLIIVGGITTALASIFPTILPSTNLVNNSLTIYNTSTSSYAYSVALGWGIFGFCLLFLYMIIQKRLLGGKIDNMEYGEH